MEEIIPYLDYGFSFIISIYLLIRMEKKIEELTKSITELNNRQKNWRDFFSFKKVDLSESIYNILLNKCKGGVLIWVWRLNTWDICI